MGPKKKEKEQKQPEVPQNDPTKEIVVAVEEQKPPPPPPICIPERWEALKSNCVEYVFPPGAQHRCGGVARMTAFAKYGPAVEVTLANGVKELFLKGGRVAQLLRRYEEELVIKDEEYSLICDVYCSAIPVASTAASMRPPKVVDAATLPRELLGECNSRKHVIWHKAMISTQFELRALLDAIKQPKFESGVSAAAIESALFNAISNALLVERQRRINILKTAVPRLTNIRTDPVITKRQSTLFYSYTTPSVYSFRSWDDPKSLMHSLHRNAYHITEHEDRNKPDVAINVRSLRSEFSLQPGQVDEGWDNYCCVRGTNLSKITTLR